MMRMTMMSKPETYKFTTSWTGYSEIIIEANNEDEAKNLYYDGCYDPSNEKMTGNGLDYGFDDEEIIELEIIKDIKDD